jgi:folate-binding protein YgfZ
MAETALHAHLGALGAVPEEDRGIWLPRHFGDPAAEYAALRAGAVLVDLGFRTLVRATGPDRTAFLQGMLSNDIARLRPGEGCPALLLTVQGRVVADLQVASFDDAIHLYLDARVREACLEALENLIIADDVELHPVLDVSLIALDGPAAAGMLDAVALAPFAHVETRVGSVPVHVLRASEVRGPGVILTAPAAQAVAVWEGLRAAGAQPCGMEALEGRRIEVGVPRIGLDMDGGTLALEVPVDEALSQSKGCYLGQEVVARGTARGHVNRRLVGLRLRGPVPPSGAPLARDGRDVGRLTSVGYAFGLGQPAALGFVRRECWEPGTELAVRHGHAVTIAQVAPWPLA